MAAFEPSIDYVVTKIPRFDFEKFPNADGILGVQMQSVGEVMAIGRTFRESIQKAYRSLEVGLNGYEPKTTDYRPLDINKISFPSAFRLLKVWQAIKEGYTIKDLYEKTLHKHNNRFDVTLEFKNRYNRLVAYNGRTWHRESNFCVPEEFRLTQIFFINKIDGNAPLKRLGHY